MEFAESSEPMNENKPRDAPSVHRPTRSLHDDDDNVAESDEEVVEPSERRESEGKLALAGGGEEVDGEVCNMGVVD